MVRARDSEFLSLVSGQDVAKRYFQRALDSERLSHAYLFFGPEGSGRRLFARELAKALHCESGSPCGACSSCVSIDHDNHPAVTIYRAPEGKSVVDIDTVRAITERTHYRTGPLQVAVLEDADQLSEPAANAVLKTLEEPPDDVIIILLARSTGVVKSTILSRCHRVPFLRQSELDKALSDEQLQVFREVYADSFYSETDPKDWVQRTCPDRGSVKDTLRALLNVLIPTLRQKSDDPETPFGHGGGTLEESVRIMEILLELQGDLQRNTQADLVLERLVRELRLSRDRLAI